MVMNSKQLAVVDVDSTLCDFSSVLYQELCRIDPASPNPSNWIEWDFWEPIMSKNEFYLAVEKAQKRLSETPMIPGANEAVKTLYKNYFVTISSHRSQKQISVLDKWLFGNGIPYDKIHLTYDKTELFGETGMRVVIDDSPIVLQAALDNDLVALGLRYPWNASMDEHGALLFDSMFDVAQYMQKNEM